jgi:hypothetical protein
MTAVTGYEAFGLYQAVKLHFTTDSYDFLKYGGKSRITVDVFENRKDKYHFYKLSRRLTNKDDLIMFLVANFVNSDGIWVGDLLMEESETIYRQRQRVIQSLSYIFENDCRKIFEGIDDPNIVLRSEGGDYPKLLTMALRKEIEIETLCLLNKILHFMPLWSKRITDTIRWPEYRRKVEKYAAFIQADTVKYKLILKKVIDENEKVVS